jgi:hypothetical protein
VFHGFRDDGKTMGGLSNLHQKIARSTDVVDFRGSEQVSESMALLPGLVQQHVTRGSGSSSGFVYGSNSPSPRLRP